MVNNCVEIHIIAIELAVSLQSTQMVHVYLSSHSFCQLLRIAHDVVCSKDVMFTTVCVFGESSLCPHCQSCFNSKHLKYKLQLLISPTIPDTSTQPGNSYFSYTRTTRVH